MTRNYARTIANKLSAASKELNRQEELICHDYTMQLRKMLKGKKVKMACFDAWVDGDDYWFEEELKDIQVYKQYDSDDGFYVVATVMYKSIFAPEKEPPKEHRFYLDLNEPIEIVK